MKHFILLSAILFAGALHAADPVVTITDLNHVLVDGKPAGTVVDAIANQPDAARFVLDWLNAREKQLADAQAEKLKAAEDRAHAAEGRALVAEQRAAEMEGAVAVKLNAEAATGEGPKARQLRELLSEFRKPARDKLAEQLAAEIAAKKKELDALKK